MFTIYLTIYSLLAVAGVIEIFTGALIKPLGIGVHAFFLIFTIIFIAQVITLLRRRAADDTLKQRTLYDTHRLSLILGTLFLLIIGLFRL